MIANVMRAVLGLGLMALLATGFLNGRDVSAPLAVTAHTSSADLATALAADPKLTLVYADSAPPSFEASVLMAGAASGGSDVTLVLPARSRAFQVVPPTDAVARRRSALEVTLRADPGTEVLVTVDSEGGTADTVSVPIGPSGVTRTRIASEPGRAGAMSWTVGALGEQIDVHAWVRPESPVRVLVLTGTPDWESRYLVRALEAAGMGVTVHQDLGRAQTVATDDGLIPRAVSDLSDVDVVAVVGATSSVPAEILTSWVAERGGGLLLVGAGAGAGGFPAWSPGRTAQTIVASSIRWGGPAEIVPLPRTDLQPLGAATGRGIPVASTGLAEAGSLPTVPGEQAAIYAAADWFGRGRIYTTGFESWGWAMEAGLGDQHRQYWESVVEWLAGGLAADLTLSARPGRVAVAWEGRLEGDVPSGVRVSGPGDSGTDSLPILTDPGSEARVRFVPTEVGGYEVDAGARSSLGVPVVPSTVPISWAQAALEIGGAGGRVTSEAEFFPTDPAAPLGRSRGMLWLLFISLAGLAVTGWAHRRIHGLP